MRATLKEGAIAKEKERANKRYPMPWPRYARGMVLMHSAKAAVSMHATATPCNILTAKKGQNGRSMIKARKVRPNSNAPNIITLLSEYLVRAPPTRNLDINDDTPKAPMSNPISLSLEPILARKIGSVGTMAEKAVKKAKNARNPRTKSGVNIFRIV
jgi:hypothetical protein